MGDIHQPRRGRKILRLKKEPAEAPEQPQYVIKSEARFMVWRDGGDMPCRVYGPDEAEKATGHAKTLAEKEQARFYVMRAWRAYDPVGGAK